MAKPRKCSFPDCKNTNVRTWRGSEPLCFGHRPKREIPGYCDVYCQLCGFGPRVTLDKHVIAFHDGTDAYRQQFGADSLSSEAKRYNARAVWKDRVEDTGHNQLTGRPKGVCKNGHRLTAKNSYVATYEGKLQRKCRECTLARNRQPALRQRKCKWCREWFRPNRRTQVCCSRRCRKRLDYWAART